MERRTLKAWIPVESPEATDSELDILARLVATSKRDAQTLLLHLATLTPESLPHFPAFLELREMINALLEKAVEEEKSQEAKGSDDSPGLFDSPTPWRTRNAEGYTESQ